MPAYPTATVEYDFQNASSYSGSGNTVYDLQSNVNLTKASGTWVSGTPNYWDLLGSTELVNTSPGAGFASSVFTINCWYYTQIPPSAAYSSVYGLGLNGPGTMPILSIPITGNPNIQWSFGYSLLSYPLSSDWNFISFVSDGITTFLYVNGIIRGFTNSTGNSIASPYAIRLGCSSNASNLAQEPSYGKLGYWSYYNSALTSGQINQIFDATSSSYIVTPPTTLIGSYDFSDTDCYPGTGNTAFDLTANNNDLVMNGAGAQPVFGGTGQSKYFSFLADNSNHLYCEQFSALGTTFGGSDFTLSVWHNYPNTQQDNAAMLFGGNGANDSGVTIQVTGNDGNKIYGGIFGDTPVVGIANTADTWHMSTFTGDGTTLKLYQDGALIGSTSQSGSWDGRGFVLGRYLNNAYAPVGTGNQLRYLGKIAIAEVYSGALGSTDISDLYDLQEPRFNVVPPPPATLKYDFSDPACYPGTGNTIYDLSGYGLDAFITNATYVGNGTSSYFDFTGTSTYIDSETFPNPDPNQWTLLAWASFDDVTSPGFIISASEANVPGGVPFISIGEITNKIRSSNAYNVDNITDPSNANNNQWYMVTYTSDGTDLKLYVDGVVVGTTTRTTANVYGTSPYVRLAGYAGYLHNGLNGKIGYAEFYAGTALTNGAINTIYNTTQPNFYPVVPIPIQNSNVGGRSFNKGING
jgi:hypothetical protein